MQVVYIYCVTNIVNNKKYVGQTRFDLKKRFSGHCTAAKQGRHRAGLARAIRKHGQENFVIEQLTAAYSRDEATQIERRMISFFDCLKNGYNMLPGGSGQRKDGNPHTKTPEWKAKMSEIRRAQWKDPHIRERMISGRWSGRVFRGRYSPPSLSMEERSARIAESNKRRSKTYHFTDPSGIVHQVSHLPSFCESNGLNSTCMCRVASGSYSSHKGWRAA